MDDLDEAALPAALAEELLAREDAARALLDDLSRLALEGRHGEVRDRIRDLASENRGLFFALALALSGSDHFFGDVESQVGMERTDRLRDLAEAYPNLAEPFGLVRLEVANDRQNPVTGLDVTTTYHADEEVPLVGYSAYSGDVELYESRGSPGEVLQSATYLVEAANDALEAAMERDHTVNTEELSGLIDRREELESELTTLADRIDELRRNPVGEE